MARITVAGMTDKRSGDRAEAALDGVPGVTDAGASPESGTVEVEGRAPPSALAAALEDAGFEVVTCARAE